MVKACETQDTLVSNSGAAKGMLGRAKAFQMLAVPCHLVCKKIKVL